MPRYPGAIQMLIPEGDPSNASHQPFIKPRGIILHTNASNGTVESLAHLYSVTDGEAHFQLETNAPFGKGRLAQFVDTGIRADNNYKANSFTLPGDSTLWGYISIETADIGAPYDKTWTDLGERKQLEDLLVWLCKTHNIPAVLCTSPTSPGIGWHAQWGFNTPCATGEGTYGHFTASDGRRGCLNNPWTNTFGKICPGPGKISEVPNLIAAVAARLQGDDSMSAADVADLKAFLTSDEYLDKVAERTLSRPFPRVKRATDPPTVSPTTTLKDSAYDRRSIADLWEGVSAPAAIDDDKRYQDLKQTMGKVTTDVNGHTDDAVKNIVVPAPPPPDMTKVTGHQPNQGDISFTQNP